MKAVCYHGRGDVRVDTVPDPAIVNPRDAIIKVTATAICGSDLHLYNGVIPAMQRGDVLGHEFMGEVVEVGSDNRRLQIGDRVVVPFTIACGNCFFCREQLWSLCDNSNPNAWLAEKLSGFSGSGLFGYSHIYGGYAGGQAEYVRVPFADVGPIKVPSSLQDEQVLFLSDILPTGYMAAENCGITPGDTIAVWGCGPVGQFAIKSAFLLGAERVIAIDRVPERLAMAATHGHAETLNYETVEDVLEELRAMTGGQGPDACIDAVGLEAHGTTLDAWYDRVKTSAYLATDRIHALRQAINACRKGGTVSIPGVYGGWLDKFPLGAAFAKGLTLKMGQTHVHRYLPALLERIERGEIDPSFVITHRATLAQAPDMYRTFRDKQDACIKVVMRALGARSRRARGSMKATARGAVALSLASVGLLGLSRALRRRRSIDFRHRVVLIFGGSRGLGLVMARELAADGARLALAARDAADLERARAELAALTEVAVIQCDVRQREQVEGAIAEAVTRFGGLDVVVNDAGIIQVGPIEHATLEDFEDAMATHFWGPLYATFAARPHLRSSNAARIINISSIGGQVSVPHLLPYSASKFALVGLSEGLHVELSREGIVVTTVSPGLMRTGSTYQAWMKGRHQQEFAWFHTAAAVPGLSIDARRAARQILEASRRGQSQVVITPSAKAARLLRTLMPETTARTLRLANRLLPSPTTTSAGDIPRRGRDSTSWMAPSPISVLNDRAGVANNEV